MLSCESFRTIYCELLFLLLHNPGTLLKSSQTKNQEKVLINPLFFKMCSNSWDLTSNFASTAYSL